MKKGTKTYIGLWIIWLVLMFLQFYCTKQPIFKYTENGLFIVILGITVMRAINKNKQT